MSSSMTMKIPSPSGLSLALVSALSNVENHALHVAAIEARDKALSDPNTYGLLLIQLSYILIGCDEPNSMIQNMDPNEITIWQQSDNGVSIQQLQQNPTLFVPFGQTAGLILKNALIRPPIHPITNEVITISQNDSIILQQSLLYGLQYCYYHNEIRSVITSIISTVAVSDHGIQPYLHISYWNNLIPTLIQNIEQYLHIISNMTPSNDINSIMAASEGSMQVIRKMMEDGPSEISEIDLDRIVLLLIQILLPSNSTATTTNTTSPNTTTPNGTTNNNTITSTLMDDQYFHLNTLRIMALQSLNICLLDTSLFSNIFVAQWTNYMNGLSYLANITSSSLSSSTTTIHNNSDNHNSPKISTSTPTSTINNNNNQMNDISNIYTTIRQWVCRNIVTILQTHTEYIIPYIQDLCPFMLSATSMNHNINNITNNSPNNTTTNNNNNSIVALEACDFWLTFATLDDHHMSGTIHDIVASYLPQLIPILLDNMIYPIEKQQELEWLNQQQEQQQMQQNSDEISPIFHKSRAGTKHTYLNKNDTSTGSKQHYIKNMNNNDIDEDDDDDDYESDDNDYNEDNEDDGWTVRKCAAASLDALSNLYGGDIILPYLLPHIEIGLQSTIQPWKQEACIMALGAIAEGCYEEMTSHMNQLYPYLMHILAPTTATATSNPTPQLPQLKCMAAWTLGQYSAWVVEQVQTNAVQGHVLAELSEVLLHNLQDTNVQVQTACSAAFGVLVGTAGDLLIPYLEPILNAISATLGRYHGRSLLSIIDVFGTLGECVGPAIADGTLPSLYMPPLLQLWERCITSSGLQGTTAPIRDRTIIPLMESLASIALSSGTNFQPYALDCFNNSMLIIESITLTLAVASENDFIREEDVDPLVAATDLIDSLVEGLAMNFTNLLNSSQRYGPQFLNMLISLCQHEIVGVRMSALALVGDLTRNTPNVLQPVISQIIHESIKCMDSSIDPTLSINAAWAIGEICIKWKDQPAIFQPYAPSLLQNAIGLLMGNGTFDDGTTLGSTIPGLIENVAACIGRLALVNPMFVANDLPRVLCAWCDGLGKIRDPTERHDAFTGFVQVIYANPQAIKQASKDVIDVMVSILFAILTWHIPNDIPDDSYTKMLTDQYRFVPFPTTEMELGNALKQLVQDMKISVGTDEWHIITKRLPVNVRKLFREIYNM